MAFKINKDDVPEVNLDSEGITSGEVLTKMVYGKSMSMVYIKRPTGYRSRPHAHDSEQFNYVLEGEMWLFIEDEGVELLRPGDFSRIPSLAVHWGIVENGPCIMVESHSPPYIGNEDRVGEDKEYVAGLFLDDEEPIADEESIDIWGADFYSEDEQALMEEYRREE